MILIIVGPEILLITLEYLKESSLAHHQFLHQVVRKNLENLMSDHLKKL